MNELVDIVTPPPPSWMPQTPGWLALGIVLLATMLWLAWRILRRWHANRFRRTALRELAVLQRMLDGAPGERITVLLALADLLKRLALAEWPRQTVAALTGPAWREFLQSRAGSAGDSVPALGALAALIDDAEYRGRPALAEWPDDQLRAIFSACRVWIAGYRRDDHA
ncbi:MAG: DUF4381 domain-containing protein [Cupriavidus sp.]|nr:DUF4381 domain-containing protein [Cupriavidus sp.]